LIDFIRFYRSSLKKIRRKKNIILDVVRSKKSFKSICQDDDSDRGEVMFRVIFPPSNVEIRLDSTHRNQSAAIEFKGPVLPVNWVRGILIESCGVDGRKIHLDFCTPKDLVFALSQAFSEDFFQVVDGAEVLDLGVTGVARENSPHTDSTPL
jgi:hypothetical protein